MLEVLFVTPPVESMTESCMTDPWLKSLIAVNDLMEISAFLAWWLSLVKTGAALLFVVAVDSVLLTKAAVVVVTDDSTAVVVLVTLATAKFRML